MRSRSRLLVALFALSTLGAGLFAACGGGGGGGGGSTPTQPPPPPTQPSVTFAPSATAGSGSLSLAMGADSTTTQLVLEVRSSGIHDLYGVAFDLQYPTNILQVTQVTSGPLLANGTFEETMTTTGNLVIGVSRLGLVPGVSDPGVLARIVLRPLASGTGAFTFSRNTALDSNGAPITVTWIAGSATTVVVP